MVRWASEVGVQDPLAMGFVVVFVGGLGGYEDRVNLSENLGIVESHRPTALADIVLAKNAQAMGHLLDASLSTPDVKYYVGLEPSRVFQVVRVKHERFPFDIENPPERALSFAIRVRIVHVHDVQVPGSDEITHFRLGGFQVTLPL